MFVVVLAFAGAVLGALGYATTPPMLIAMGIVLAVDIAILLFSRRRLVCYRCRTSYHGLPPARYHRSWDRSTAERYAGPVKAESAAEPARPRNHFRRRTAAAPPGPAAAHRTAEPGGRTG